MSDIEISKREQKLKYAKEYYTKHKEKMIKQQTIKVECEHCKMYVCKSNLKQHQKNRNCLNHKIEKKIEIKNEEKEKVICLEIDDEPSMLMKTMACVVSVINKEEERDKIICEISIKMDDIDKKLNELYDKYNNIIKSKTKYKNKKYEIV
jgi:hypothetical protein